MCRLAPRIGCILIPALLLSSPGFSQYYFGRNKVQYNNFKWYILQTEHFDIYFYPEMKELTEIGAASAEETYRFLEDKFSYSVDRRIPLIFYSNHAHFQQTNTIPYLLPEGVGGFFEFIKGRVVVPSNGSIPEFKRIIRHELIHVFTHSKHYRVLKDHRKTHYPALPLWFVEGLAEYWSQGWDEEPEMFIKDAVLNGYLVPLGEMYQIYGSFLMYKEGQAILKFIADTFGEEKIIQFIENTWKDDDFSNVMKLTIGLNYKEFDREWLYHLKKQHYPIMAENDFPEMVARQITYQGINTKPTYFLNNGQRTLTFVSNRTGYSDIYQMVIPDEKLDKEKSIEALVKGERTDDFESFHILNSKIDMNDKGLLTFISKSGESDVIYIYDIKTRTMIKNFKFKDIITLFSPSWSPDGTKLAFCGISFSGKSDLYTVNIEDDHLIRLTNDFFDDRDPVWDQEGRYIYFSSDRAVIHGSYYYNIFALNLITGQINYITNGNHNDYTPAISPDNRYLAFTSDRDGAFNIWLIENPSSGRIDYLADRATLSPPSFTSLPDFSLLAGRNQARKITNFTTGAYDPEWTDDNQILFTAFEKFSFQIQILDKVLERFDSTKVVQRDSLQVTTLPYIIPKLVAPSVVSTVRYKPKFNLDVAQSQVMQDPIFGVSGGAQLAMSDMLGNYQYHFLVFNNAQTKEEFLESFNIAVSRLDLSHRTNYAIGLYHFAGRYFNWYEGFFYERRYGGFASVSYPLSVFQRIEASVNFRHSFKEWYGINSRKALLASNFIGFVKDNSLWGPSGPMDGERINITLGNTLDVQHSNVNFYTIIFDARKYFRLSRRVTYAVRAMTRYNHGKEALPFFMGGSWDLRGYRRWSLWGKKIFLINHELRYPFIDRFIINFPFGGMGFSAIRGATFIDLGNAWDDQLNSVLGSMGLGMRFRIGGFLVLRFDFGKKFAFYDTKNFLNPGKFQLQKGLFTQFFFGWDF